MRYNINSLPVTWTFKSPQYVWWEHTALPASHGRYNLTIQSMIEFRLKMIQFNFQFKRKLSKMIQFNFQFKRNCQDSIQKKYSIRKKTRFNSKKYSIQNHSRPIQFNNIFNSKLLLANSIQWNIQLKSWISRGIAWWIYYIS